MKNYNLSQYDDQRNWISKARRKNIPWEKIYYGKGSNDSDLEEFLKTQEDVQFWEITTEDWKSLVKLEMEGEERRKRISGSEKISVIGGQETTNNIKDIPTGRNSCWQKYRKHLLDDEGFLVSDVQAIESSSFRVLQRLNSRTKGNAVKGLVVGNVQSGKTANMAALMAMAADYGWNMFIVLSGTIENLRIQTLNRLLSDLNLEGCNLTWNGISHPSRKCTMEDKAQTLNFEEGSPNRYITVCLKNSSRLKDLIQWVHEDEKTVAQMKVLVIDDESDQASVNTKKVDSDERTKINELLVNLVENKNEKGNLLNRKFMAMNYIGYTATPYANVLNEAGEDSLYPKDFIATLHVSKTYFGPQQIFGDRTTGIYRGMNIIREIEAKEVKDIKSIHNGECYENLEKLNEAICWLLCCAAAFRYWEYKKPASMLIHTSQITKHHEKIEKYVNEWFKRPKDYILQQCKAVWSRETAEFSKSDLYESYPEFAVEYEEIKDYPQYDRIYVYLNEILDNGVENIRLGDEGTMCYSRGVHLCVDNCKNNGVKEDGTYMRLAYPNSKSNPDYSTAFIVIGGATLSRGLTIEGLVSTYFLRSTKQGDTLMQMGRWFGYRRGYELLQRIWITDNVLRQFQFLADMDSELREYISLMELFNKRPSDYAVVIKQSPSANLLKISARNKTQSAVSAELNYSGLSSQTQLFIDDEDVLHRNYNIASHFIDSLGTGDKGHGELGKSSYIWRDIPFERIYDELLCQYEFHEKLMTFSMLESLKEWVNKFTAKGMLSNWNVVLFGLDHGEEKTTFKYVDLYKVHRTRKLLRKRTIDIGVLTDPKEKVADVDYRILSDEGKNKYDNYRTEYVWSIRKDAGLETTPSLVLYVIEKNSKVKNNTSRRHDLNTSCDLIGLSINIPGDRTNRDYTESIAIDLKKFGLGNDIEGEDYDN